MHKKKKSIQSNTSIYYFFGIIILLMLLPFHPLMSQDIDQYIDFSIDLRKLSTLVSQGDGDKIDFERKLIIDGVVTMIDIYDPEKETFFAVIELTAGEWVGLEDVIAYRCYIEFEGPQFFDLFPDPRSRSRESVTIELNNNILIVGNYFGYFDDGWGNLFPLLLAEKARAIN